MVMHGGFKVSGGKGGLEKGGLGEEAVPPPPVCPPRPLPPASPPTLLGSQRRAKQHVTVASRGGPLQIQLPKQWRGASGHH